MSSTDLSTRNFDFIPWQMPNFNHQVPRGVDLEVKADKVLKEAYAEGFELGRKEGIEKARSETAMMVNQFAKVLESLNAYTHDFDDQIARDLVSLSGKIAEQIIHRELTVSPEAMYSMIEKIVGNLPGEDFNVSILLNPGDAAAFRDQLHESSLAWKIIDDAEIERGDCRVQSNNSTVNCKLADQVIAILEASLDDDEFISE